MLLKNGLFLASLLFMAPATFAATTWPLTIENCGVKQTFTQAPQRVVTVGQHETELLLALGLEKTIAATSVWFGKLPPTLEDAGKNLPGLRIIPPPLRPW